MNKTYNWYLNSDTSEHWTWATVFSKQECDAIISIGLGSPMEQAVVVNKTEEVDESIRKSNISWISNEEQNRWIFQKCTDFINHNNSTFFNYDLTQIENLQFTAYDDTGSYYGKHIDTMYSAGRGASRKLSFSIQLSDPETYEGGELHLHYSDDPIIAKKDIGVATFFPSTMMHEVTPITSGIRYALVGWVIGPKFK